MIKRQRLLLAAATVILLACGVVIYQHSANNSANQPFEAAKPLSHDQFEEVKARLVRSLNENDPKASFDYLRNELKENPSLARECHPLLHHLGHAAYGKYEEFNKTINYQDGLCNSGYTHGTIEAHFMKSDDIETTLKTTCIDQGGTTTFSQWQCFHGIGHGVMYFTGKDLAQSLSLCESLPTDFAQSSCANGAFMERFIIVSHSGAQASNTSNINISLCQEQNEIYKPYCYTYAPTAYLERNTNRYTGAFEECGSVEEKHIGTCFYGVGSQALKENVTRPDVARDICVKAPKDYKNSCIAGAINLLINHHATTDPVEPLCSTTFMKYRAICTEEIRLWNESFAS